MSLTCTVGICLTAKMGVVVRPRGRNSLGYLSQRGRTKKAANEDDSDGSRVGPLLSLFPAVNY